MPRKLKPYLISEVTDKESGHKIQVMLDRNDKKFFADVLGTHIEDPTAEGCQQRAMAHIKTKTDLVWHKIIEVRSCGYYTKGVELTYEVHEFAEKVSKQSGQSFNYTKRQLIHHCNKTDPITYSYQDFCKPQHVPESGIFVFPWSEEMEAALKDTQARIKELREKLKQILGQKDAAEHLSKIGWDLLTTRKGEKE